MNIICFHNLDEEKKSAVLDLTMSKRTYRSKIHSNATLCLWDCIPWMLFLAQSLFSCISLTLADKEILGNYRNQ